MSPKAVVSTPMLRNNTTTRCSQSEHLVLHIQFCTTGFVQPHSCLTDDERSPNRKIVKRSDVNVEGAGGHAHLLGEGGNWGALGGVAGRGQDTQRVHTPPVSAWGQALLSALPLALLLALQQAHSAQMVTCQYCDDAIQSQGSIQGIPRNNNCSSRNLFDDHYKGYK